MGVPILSVDPSERKAKVAQRRPELQEEDTPQNPLETTGQVKDPKGVTATVQPKIRRHKRKDGKYMTVLSVRQDAGNQTRTLSSTSTTKETVLAAATLLRSAAPSGGLEALVGSVGGTDETDSELLGVACPLAMLEIAVEVEVPWDVEGPGWLLLLEIVPVGGLLDATSGEDPLENSLLEVPLLIDVVL
ncbi:hypothetical protein EXIGLDRAFT_754329 [Exidia glandulosa HHB12029]|uniref:Uncharacterized protein n=1 Tax=Exidia glandulosa HHB12029 TaxID=1314781 RepID=A0A165CZZ5_EXIGL|nr:hypothetical protein EXIGLDRAFT_754329 [Exidia glandulosa HHB12029]